MYRNGMCTRYIEVVGDVLHIVTDTDTTYIDRYAPSIEDVCASDWEIIPLNTFKVSLKVEAELEIYVPAKDFVDAKLKAKQISPSRANFVKYDYSTLQVTDKIEQSDVRMLH